MRGTGTAGGWLSATAVQSRTVTCGAGTIRLCTLVILGVRADGTKELVALEDGCRESAESWASVLRDLRGRGLSFVDGVPEERRQRETEARKEAA